MIEVVLLYVKGIIPLIYLRADTYRKDVTDLKNRVRGIDGSDYELEGEGETSVELPISIDFEDI